VNFIAAIFLTDGLVVMVANVLLPLLDDSRPRPAISASRAGTSAIPAAEVPLPPVPGTDPFGEPCIVPRWVREGQS